APAAATAPGSLPQRERHRGRHVHRRRSPLLPFSWPSEPAALITAIVRSALVLFGVGTYQAVTLAGDWRKKGLQLMVAGLAAAAAGFLIGRLFHTAGA